MQPDLIQRSRAGDREAFAGLVSLWGDRALQIALVCTMQTEDAVAAVARAMRAAYMQIPSLHPRSTFRPWLMRLVVKEAGSDPRDERLRALLGSKGQRGLARADEAIVSHLAVQPKYRLPERFFTDEVEPHLEEPLLRAVGRPAPAWRVDDLAFAAGATSGTPGASVWAKPGMQRRLRGAQPGPLKSRDILTVLDAVPGTRLAWSATSSFPLTPGSIDVVYAADVTREDLTLYIRGVAIADAPLLGKWWRAKAEAGLAVREARMRSALAPERR